MTEDIQPVSLNLETLAQTPPIPAAYFMVRGDVIYSSRGGGPELIVSPQDNHFQRVLMTDEQPWRRNMTIGPEWTELDLGWTVENGKMPAQVIVINQEGFFPQTIPYPEEKKKVFGLIVLLAVEFMNDGPCDAVSFAKVRPLENCRFEPVSRVIFARCPTGKAKVTVVSVPGDE